MEEKKGCVGLTVEIKGVVRRKSRSWDGRGRRGCPRSHMWWVCWAGSSQRGDSCRLCKRRKGLNDHSAGCDGSKPWLQHCRIFPIKMLMPFIWGVDVSRRWKVSSSLMRPTTNIPACRSTYGERLSFSDLQTSSLCLRHSGASESPPHIGFALFRSPFEAKDALWITFILLRESSEKILAIPLKGPDL